MEVFLYKIRCYSCANPIEAQRLNFLALIKTHTTEEAMNKLKMFTECCRYSLVYGSKFPLLEPNIDVVSGRLSPREYIRAYDLDTEVKVLPVIGKVHDLEAKIIPTIIGIPTNDIRYTDSVKNINEEKIITRVGYIYLAR